MFSRSTASAALAMLMLTGCAAAPTLAPNARAQASVGARSRNVQRVELRLPRAVLLAVDAYRAELEAEYGREYETDMYGRPTTRKYAVDFALDRAHVKVVASADAFRTRLEENGWDRTRRTDGNELLVPFNAAAGEVRYYLELSAAVKRVATGKLEKTLPVRYISNLGANYAGRLAPEKAW